MHCLASNILKNFYKFKRKLQLRTASTTHVFSSKKPPPSILFFGTDQFSLPSLKALHQNCNSSSLGVVTSFKNPANCVRRYAETENLFCARWPINSIGNYDLGVVVSFGHMIPEKIIRAFPLGMINVHASLLPRWRGAAPIIYALMHGDAVTGVSIMKIAPKHFDIGDILAQQKVPIKENCLMTDLHIELANRGAQLLVEVVNDYQAKSKEAQKQDDSLATFAPRITSEILEIDWSSLTAEDLHRRHRALYGYKNLYTKFQGKNVQLIDLNMCDHSEKHIIALKETRMRPGDIHYRRDHKTLVVCCVNNSFIEITQLRIEGKKVMSALEFNNGFLKKVKNRNELFFESKQNNKAAFVQ